MKISIIICTYNRSDILMEVLKNITKMDLIEKTEILIVNNKSTDNTDKLIERFANENSNLSVLNIFEENQGLSFARNRGIEESTGDVIAFLDDDAFPDHRWIRVIQEFFSIHKDVIAIGGKVVGRFEIEKPKWLSKEINMVYSLLDLGDCEKEFLQGFPIGVNFAVRRIALGEIRFSTELGRKKDSLLSGEETSLMRSLKSVGKIYYVPDMYVEHFIHKERLSKDWVVRRNYAGGKTEMRMNTSQYKKLRLLFRSFMRKMGRKVRYKFFQSNGKDFKLKYKIAYDQGIIDEFFKDKDE